MKRPYNPHRVTLTEQLAYPIGHKVFVSRVHRQKRNPALQSNQRYLMSAQIVGATPASCQIQTVREYVKGEDRAVKVLSTE